MIVYLKYVILAFGFIAGFYSFQSLNTSAGFTAAGAFIAFALLEIQDIKTLNEKEEEEEK
jgi:hypothetical protein